jgi:hypothetical protein
MLWLATVRHMLWLGVHLLLLVTLGLSFVLPLVDHHAAERDPWHDHIVLGGSQAQQVATLHDHSHGYEHSHSHNTGSEAVVDATGGAHILVVSSRHEHSPLAIGLTGKAVAIPPAPFAPCLALSSNVPLPPSPPLAGYTSLVPAPPPRLPSLNI